METLIHLVAPVLMFLLYMLAVEFRDLLYSVITLAGASVLLAFVFYVLQAPDIAITQAAVGAGVSTVLFVIAISRTRREEE
jgi:uncharacterized MnhB-related membrane protein